MLYGEIKQRLQRKSPPEMLGLNSADMRQIQLVCCVAANFNRIIDCFVCQTQPQNKVMIPMPISKLPVSTLTVRLPDASKLTEFTESVNGVPSAKGNV